jgi:hypothetical protein
MNIEDRAKSENNRYSPLWLGLEELEAASYVIERYSDTLRRLADS